MTSPIGHALDAINRVETRTVTCPDCGQEWTEKYTGHDQASPDGKGIRFHGSWTACGPTCHCAAAREANRQAQAEAAWESEKATYAACKAELQELIDAQSVAADHWMLVRWDERFQEDRIVTVGELVEENAVVNGSIMVPVWNGTGVDLWIDNGIHCRKAFALSLATFEAAAAEVDRRAEEEATKVRRAAERKAASDRLTAQANAHSGLRSRMRK